MTIIYSEALKALYGTVDESIYSFESLSDFLIKDLGFERSPYDWCVVNKVIDDKQCTIAWHVDGLIISHANPDTVTDIIGGLSKKYGDIMP